MKRVTQKKLLEYANQLPPLTESQKRYAMKHLPVVCFKYRKRLYNGDTGQVIPVTEKLPKNCCDDTNRTSHYGRNDTIFKYTVISVFKGVQVLRTFWVTKCSEIGKPVKFLFDEVYQNWYYDGKRAITGKPLIATMWTSGNFDLSGKYNIKRINKYCYYDTYSECYLSHISKMKDDFKKKGLALAKNIVGISLEKLFEEVPKDNRLETLLKIGYLNQVTMRLTTYNECLVANRHHYKPSNWDTWKDHILNIQELGLDTKSPRYVCPKDLEKEHNVFLKRLQKRRQKEEIEKEMMKNKDFEKRMKKFKDLVISNNGIRIVPLMTIKDVFAEAEIMHHCVFERKYYKKKNSILLSAQSEGKHLETIEYDIVSNSVLQSRGQFNKFTDRHDTIIQMMSKLHIYKNRKFKVS